MFEIILSGKAPIYEQLYNGVDMLISSGRQVLQLSRSRRCRLGMVRIRGAHRG